MPGDSIPTETVTRKPDSDVGTLGKPAVGGGRQTPEQAAITGQGSRGRADSDRDDDWSGSGGEPGRSPPALGGSSDGQSDRNAARGPREGERVAAGHYKVEQETE